MSLTIVLILVALAAILTGILSAVIGFHMEDRNGKYTWPLLCKIMLTISVFVAVFALIFSLWSSDRNFNETCKSGGGYVTNGVCITVGSEVAA